MRITYDKDVDVLYIVFVQSSAESDYIEQQPGLVYRVDLKSRDLLGLTIIDFASRFGDRAEIPVSVVATLPAGVIPSP